MENGKLVLRVKQNAWNFVAKGFWRCFIGVSGWKVSIQIPSSQRLDWTRSAVLYRFKCGGALLKTFSVSPQALFTRNYLGQSWLARRIGLFFGLSLFPRCPSWCKNTPIPPYYVGKVTCMGYDCCSDGRRDWTLRCRLLGWVSSHWKWERPSRSSSAPNHNNMDLSTI